MILREAHAIAPDRVQAKLRLMATTDLHAQILPYDYYADTPLATGGLAQIAGLVRLLRRGAPNSLLLDNGDFVQGNPLADLAAGAGRADPHPVVAAMNALGYDAGTLGNHEFNYGLGLVEKIRGEAAFPLVLANLAEGAAPVRPWAVLDRVLTDTAGRDWPLKVGVIGFAPPQIALWERLRLTGRIATEDIVQSARRHLPDLRAAGAEIVVALCHSGIGAADHAEGMENAALPLSAVEGIDILVLGHTHGIFPTGGLPVGGGVDPVVGTLNGKPAVMAGAYGSHLGLIDLLMDRHEDQWRIAGHAVAALPASGQVAGAGPPPADAEIARITAPAHARVLDLIRRPIGRTDLPLTSHFSLVAPDASLAVVAAAQRDYAASLLAGSPEARLPLLSAVAPFRAGGRGGPEGYIDIPAGPLSMRHAAELYVYPNTICVIAVTGAMVAGWLERSSGQFNTLQPGMTDQPLIDPTFPSYNFDLLDGLTWVIDPVVPAGAGRVSGIRWQGRPLAADATVAVVTNSYRAGGGGGFEALAGAQVLHAPGRPTRDVVVDYLHRRRPGPPSPSWRFAPHPGTAAWFDSGPRARQDTVPALALDDLGVMADGFRRFRLHL